MALSIHTNYSSLVTQTNLSKTNNALSNNQQRLGTGLRINSAADDAAGLQIATRLNAQSRGMAVATRNISDATSLLQTAEGAFSEMTDIVQRMKDLSTQGANGTNSGADLIALQGEYDELGKELANVIKNTKYAGTGLFSDGTVLDASKGKFSAAVSFQIGSSASETLSLDMSTALGNLTTALGNVSDTYTTPTAAGVEIATTADATTAANTNANGNITLLETALNKIGDVRATLGANINRLGHTANNLANMKDNTDVAKGNIMDADFAKESASMTKNSMLLQSGISMLKQAGQMPSMVMSLLG
jgi:flagellin